MTRKPLFPVIATTTILGLLGLLRSLPRMEAVYGPDKMSLWGAGFCFGIAFGMSIVLIRTRAKAED
jgi:hypothetical protein